MQMLKVFEKRRSIRDYKEKGLSESDNKLVRNLIAEIPQVANTVNLKATLLENGEEIAAKLDGVAGYNGVMIKAPHYLMICSDESEIGSEVAGYIGEWLILNLTKSDIATTWIDINNQQITQELICSEEKRVLRGLIAVGYPKMDIRVSNVYNSYVQSGYKDTEIEYSDEPQSSRKSVEEFVYINEWSGLASLDDLKDRALDNVFYYMRLAPSWGNRQPWKFLLMKNDIYLCIEKSEQAPIEMQMLESGIAMLYFEVAMHDSGFPGGWDMADNGEEIEVPENCFVAGKYSF